MTVDQVLIRGWLAWTLWGGALRGIGGVDYWEARRVLNWEASTHWTWETLERM